MEITQKDDVRLDNITELPDNYEFTFNTKGGVCLGAVQSLMLPPDTEFENIGNIYLDDITKLPDKYKF